MLLENHSIKKGIFYLWLLTIVGVYSPVFPRPFSDPKDYIFYLGGSFLFLAVLSKMQQRLKIQWNVLVLWLSLYITWIILTLSFSSVPLIENLFILSRFLLWACIIYTFYHIDTQQLIDGFRIVVYLIAAIVAYNWIIFYLNPLTAQKLLFPIGHVTYFGDIMAFSYGKSPLPSTFQRNL